MKIDDRPLTQDDAFEIFNMSKDNLKKLGITNYTSKKFEKIHDIYKKDTGMIIAQALANFTLSINDVGTSIKKGSAYVMPLGEFIQSKKNKTFKAYRHTFSKYFKRYTGQDLTNKKLLVWRTGGLGDIIVSQSVIKAIKDKYPSCEITYATSPAFLSVFASWPSGLVDKISTLPFPKELLEENDYHLTFIHAIENCIESQKYNYYDIFKKIVNMEYETDKYISNLLVNPILKNQVKKQILPNTILLHMSSTTALRAMDNMKWVNIINILLSKGFNVGIIDQPKKAREIDLFIKGIRVDDTKVQNLAKLSLTIPNAIAIFDCCVGGICIDSSFAHIAGALNKPAAVICGPYKSYNVVGLYPSVVGVDPEDWNECGKYSCHLNSQQHLCPFLCGGTRKTPGCIDSILEVKIVEALEKSLQLQK